MPPRAPCGTSAAYRRHRRNNEDPCAECKAAVRDGQRESRQQERDQAAEVLTGTHVEPVSDRLVDAEANLRSVVAVMDSGMALAQTAQLSKRRQELHDYIADLKAEAQSGAEVSKYDEIAARRRRRKSAA